MQQETRRFSSHRNNAADDPTIHQANLPANAVPDSVVSRPRCGCVSSQVRLRLVPGSLSNRGSLTEIISLSPEMVIPPSLPSIIRNTDGAFSGTKTIGFSIILSDISAISPTATLSRSTQIAFQNIKPHLLPSPRPTNLLKTRANKSSVQIKKGHLIAQMSFLRYPADSNCCTRFCRPLPSHSVRVPLLLVCECKVKTLFSLHQTFRQKISLFIKNMADTYSKEPLFQLFIEDN